MKFYVLKHNVATIRIHVKKQTNLKNLLSIFRHKIKPRKIGSNFRFEIRGVVERGNFVPELGETVELKTKVKYTNLIVNKFSFNAPNPISNLEFLKKIF